MNFENWFTRLHLECTPFTEYATISAAYFVGYGIGILFLFLPDLLGRRGCMMLILPLYIMVTSLSVLSDDIAMKRMGFFLQGLFHIKISNSYTHMFELVPESAKVIGQTCINSYDACTLLIVCVAIKFGGASYQQVAEIQLYVGSVACVLYFLIVPESPTWYFL